MRGPSIATHRTGGLTLVELLVASAVLLVVVTLAGSALIQGLRVHRLNESITSAQSKMRRVTEVVSQDLRSIALGGLVDVPYVSGSDRISFTLLEGPRDDVLPHDSGLNASFIQAANHRIISTDATELEGRQVLLTNADGEGQVVTVRNVARIGGGGSLVWNLVHPPGCRNGIAYTPGTTLSHPVQTVGIALDTDTGRLMRQEAGRAAQPLAFDIVRFELAYVYANADGGVVVRDEPIDGADGAPARRVDIAGVPHTLDAVQVTIATRGDDDVERSYVAQVALPEPIPSGANSVEVCE